MPAPNPSATVVIREHRGRPFYEAKFRHEGRQVKRRIGPAWLERDPDTNGWRRHRGRILDGAFDERRAHVESARIVDEYVARAAEIERDAQERRSRGATFREVATSYLSWLENVRGAKPATLRDHKYVLGEPGVAYKNRTTGVSAGHVMVALGDRRRSPLERSTNC